MLIEKRSEMLGELLNSIKRDVLCNKLLVKSVLLFSIERVCYRGAYVD